MLLITLSTTQVAVLLLLVLQISLILLIITLYPFKSLLRGLMCIKFGRVMVCPKKIRRDSKP